MRLFNDNSFLNELLVIPKMNSSQKDNKVPSTYQNLDQFIGIREFTNIDQKQKRNSTKN